MVARKCLAQVMVKYKYYHENLFCNMDEAYQGFYNTEFHRQEAFIQNLRELEGILTLIVNVILENSYAFEGKGSGWIFVNIYDVPVLLITYFSSFNNSKSLYFPNTLESITPFIIPQTSVAYKLLMRAMCSIHLTIHR
jgi:hypothetical protein